MGSIFKLTALAGVAAGAYAVVKKFAPNILPDKNEAADMAKNAINSVKLTFPTDEKYSNGTALTPPMGWSSWNTFRNRIDEKLILETAEAMKASGLADAGYQYVNLDDCWQSSMRDENGRLQGDFANFPSGIPALVKSLSSSKAFAVMAMIGIFLASSRSNIRIAFVASRPSMTGIITSMMMKSYSFGLEF